MPPNCSSDGFNKNMLIYSKIRPRLRKIVYVDFDGLCGGYNLMLAFSSALEIFKDICNTK